MATTPQIVGKPETRELVTNAILRVVGLNAQAFTGSQNPSSIYQTLVSGYPSVFPYYRELEEKDTAISSALAMRRALVIGRERNVESANPEDGRAQQIADAAAQFLDDIRNFRFALWELLDAPAYGYAVAEIMWAIFQQVSCERLIGRPQELFRFGKMYDPQTGELLLANYAGGEGSPVPPFKFLVSTYQPRHGDRRGLPLLRKLYWSSWFKRNVLHLHLHFLEKGNGTVIVKYPAGAGDDDKTKAQEAADAIAKEIGVAVPESFNLMAEALQTTRTRNAEDFRSFVDYLDAEMTRVILGQTLTSRGSEQHRGSMALGQVHENMMWEIVRNDASDLEDVINGQLLAPWLRWTFGEQALQREFRPYWRIEKDPPKDAAAALDLVSKAHQLVDVAKSEVYAAAQMRAPEEDDDKVERAPTAASLFA